MTPQEYRLLQQERTKDTFKLDPLVSINLKDKEYTLEFNNTAVKAVLKELGVNLLNEGFNQGQLQDPDILSHLICIGLKANHSDVTIEEVDRQMNIRYLPYYLNRLRTAIDLFLPDMSDSKIDVEEELKENP